MTKDELKEWRRKHNISQQQLADFLGVAKVTVGRWEIGMRQIPPFLHLALRSLEKSKKKGGEKRYGLHKKKKR